MGLSTRMRVCRAGACHYIRHRARRQTRVDTERCSKPREAWRERVGIFLGCVPYVRPICDARDLNLSGHLDDFSGPLIVTSDDKLYTSPSRWLRCRGAVQDSELMMAGAPPGRITFPFCFSSSFCKPDLEVSGRARQDEKGRCPKARICYEGLGLAYLVCWPSELEWCAAGATGSFLAVLRSSRMDRRASME